MADPTLEVASGSEAETRRLGGVLGALLRAGDLILLKGPYGAGKTVFAKGIAAGLGIDEEVSSPSFALVNEYASRQAGRPPLFHMDLYRLRGAAELHGLGVEEYLDAGVTVIEWPEVAASELPPDRLELELAPAGADRRLIRARAGGPRARELIEAWRQGIGAAGIGGLAGGASREPARGRGAAGDR